MFKLETGQEQYKNLIVKTGQPEKPLALRVEHTAGPPASPHGHREVSGSTMAAPCKILG